MSLKFSKDILEIDLNYKVEDLDFTNDGKYIALAFMSVHRGSAIKVYSTETGEVVSEYGKDAFQGKGVVFGENGTKLYFILRDDEGNDTLYRAALTGGELEHVGDYGIRERSHSLIRNNDGSLIAVLGNIVQVWDAAGMQIVRHINGLNKEIPIYGCFNNNLPELYIYGVKPNEIVHFDLAKNQEIKTLPAPAEYGDQIIVSPNGKYLLAVGNTPDGVYLYKMPEGERFLQKRYDETTPTGIYNFSFDSSLITTWGGICARGRRLPEGKSFAGEKEIPFELLIKTISAIEAPIVAYVMKSNKLLLVSLESESDSSL